MGATGYLARLRECVGHDLLLAPAAAACIRDEEGRILYHPLTNLIMTSYTRSLTEEAAFFPVTASDGTRDYV